MRNRDFRISADSRDTMTLFDPVFETDEDLRKMYRQAQKVAGLYNDNHDEKVSPAKLNISAVLHLIYQTVISNYLNTSENNPFSRISTLAEKNENCADVLYYYDKKFPSKLEFENNSIKESVAEETARAFFVHQVFQANPALLSAMKQMLDQSNMNFPDGVKALRAMMSANLQKSSSFIQDEEDLFSFLTRPAKLFPDSLVAQINYILKYWDYLLPEELKTLLLKSLDFVTEEEKQHVSGAGEVQLPFFGEGDSESFTEDRSWMPNVVMIAKSTLVWLDQLSKKYHRDIHTLDQIPDEELDAIKDSGFTALWLIGLWERSPASKKIKNLCGNPDAESSAYSLKSYNISSRIGGWDSLNNLRTRCSYRGIRLASDMVPNHTGLDSDWIYNHGDYFVQQDYPPFPSYSYTGEDLSIDPNYEIKIEDHYFNRTDAAVTFMKRDKRTGETKFVFHGNDGTTMPWNDTAQLDFLNPNTREAVIQQILDVARNFPIIRFDAAMTLAKRHIQRLWYPKPGTGGDVAGRVEHELSEKEFNEKMPVEFWREVVDRIQKELPDTLLLAEAFWMMEGYFVRTLGMHRVYNSAFMHMMKNQDNKKYRDSIKTTLAYDPEILKRYVNFMNNPDEETAIAQFGNSDKYFGVCTLLATMPGLPMFGHGQIEGFREKYGMEYQRAYWDEQPNENLVNEHRRRIFPLLKMRHLFSGCKNFQLFDVVRDNNIQESVYAYTNGDDNQMTLILYNNAYEHVEGKIFQSVGKINKSNPDRPCESINLAQSLRLTMSPRRYMIYTNFNDGLTYICPSMKIYEEGYWVSLNGYETRVLTNIHEIEDVDGVIEKLYQSLNGRGIYDLENEIKLMYLKPFFEAVECMKNQKYQKSLKLLISGRSSANARRDVMQTLATCYTYAEEFAPSFQKMGLSVRSIKPELVIANVRRIEEVCSIKVFSDTNRIMLDDLEKIISASFMIMPFVPVHCSMEDAVEACKALMVDRFFETDIKLLERSSVFVSHQPKQMEDLLNNKVFLDLIGSNFYNGIQWFNGEYCPECIYINFLASAFFDYTDAKAADYEKKIGFWLRKCNSAQYKVEGLK